MTQTQGHSNEKDWPYGCWTFCNVSLEQNKKNILQYIYNTIKTTNDMCVFCFSKLELTHQWYQAKIIHTCLKEQSRI